MAPSNGEDHLYAVAPAIAGPPPPVDIATTVVAAVDAYGRAVLLQPATPARGIRENTPPKGNIKIAHFVLTAFS